MGFGFWRGVTRTSLSDAASSATTDFPLSIQPRGVRSRAAGGSSRQARERTGPDAAAARWARAKMAVAREPVGMGRSLPGRVARD